MKPEISIIAIVSRNGAIGRGGDQPFHISADFKRFKQLTLGKPIVMGRRTFEALPAGALPGRKNIVVSRTDDYHPDGATRVGSLAEAIKAAEGAEEIMIIGGGQIYAQAMPLATKLLLTEVDADVEDADTFFPPIDKSQWHEVEKSPAATDPRTDNTYRFVTYLRQRPGGHA